MTTSIKGKLNKSDGQTNNDKQHRVKRLNFIRLRDDPIHHRTMIRRGGPNGGLGGSFSASDRVCGRCRTELGRIINRGAVCRSCNIRVCKTCREYTSRNGQDWVCSICHRQRDLAPPPPAPWVNEFIPNNGKKGGGKVYVPSNAELIKRNIRRSWTISNPSGTEGPMLTPRNGPPPDTRIYASRAEFLPPEHDDLYGGAPPPPPPLPLSSRPVVVAQIPPPPSRVQQRFNNGIALNKVNNRNAPVRTQSLGVGDSGRFIARGGAPPRFRAPPLPSDDRRFQPPPENRRRIDLFDTSSDGEADFYEDTMVGGNGGGMAGIADFRSLDRKRLNHENRMRIAENQQRSRSGGDPNNGSLERRMHYNSAADYHSLGRRGRRLPDPPPPPVQGHYSLPRQEKRDREKEYHSSSLGDLAVKRKLPEKPGRDAREPTPDYDLEPSPPLQDKRKLTRRASDTSAKAGGRRHEKLLKQNSYEKGSSPHQGKSPGRTQSFAGSRQRASPAHSINFSDLESTRVDFDESMMSGSGAGGLKTSNNHLLSSNNVILESDNNSDIMISDDKRMVPEGKDFKIVFISSESKSGSELNSSMECDPAGMEGRPSSGGHGRPGSGSRPNSGGQIRPNSGGRPRSGDRPTSGNLQDDEQLKHVKGDFIDEMDWVNYKKKVLKNKKHKSKPAPKHIGNDQSSSPKTFMLDDFHYVGNLNGEPRIVPAISPKHAAASEQSYQAKPTLPQSPIPKRIKYSPMRTSPRRPHDSPRLRNVSNSPSIRTILTTATRDENSIPPSPSLPKIHNIAIRREYDLPPRPRSALSIGSVTSQDLEVQNILGSKHRHRTSEAQLLDHDLLELDEGEEDLLEGHGSSSGAAGSQPVHLTQLKKLPGKKIRKPSVFSTRSSAERSMDEMSLHDQILKTKDINTNSVEEYRNMVLAEIKAIQGNGLTSRSLSESDLSEMDGASFKRAADNLKAAGDNERASKEAAAAENSGKQSRNSGRNSSNKEQHPSPSVSQKQQCHTPTSSLSSSLTSTPPVLPPKTRRITAGGQLAQLGSAVYSSSGKCGKDNVDQSEASRTAGATGGSQSEARVASEYQNNNNIALSASSLSASNLISEFITNTSYKTSENNYANDENNPASDANNASTVSNNQKHTNKVKINPFMGSMVDESEFRGSNSTSVTSLGRSVSNVGHASSRKYHSKTSSDEKQYRLDTDLSHPYLNKAELNHNPQYSAFQGSNTIPRGVRGGGQIRGGAGNPAQGNNEESHIVITKKLTGAGSSVRIRIGGSTRSPTRNFDAQTNNWDENKKDLERTGSRAKRLQVEAQNRRYDLEQIEREEFRTDSDSANISDNECPVDDPASDFDLNSLVEGVVDDDSDTPTATEDNVDTSGSIKEIEGSVDDYTDDELSEINQQKAGGGASSDTEADFLDKVDRKSRLMAANAALNSSTAAVKLSATSTTPVNKTPTPAMPSPSLLTAKPYTPTASRSPFTGSGRSLPATPKSLDLTPRTTPQNLDTTSDLDSISTTSASYLVAQSDLESFCLDDLDQESIPVDSLDVRTMLSSGEGGVVKESIKKTDEGGRGAPTPAHNHPNRQQQHPKTSADQSVVVSSFQQQQKRGAVGNNNRNWDGAFEGQDNLTTLVPQSRVGTGGMGGEEGGGGRGVGFASTTTTTSKLYTTDAVRSSLARRAEDLRHHPVVVPPTSVSKNQSDGGNKSITTSYSNDIRNNDNNDNSPRVKAASEAAGNNVIHNNNNKSDLPLVNNENNKKARKSSVSALIARFEGSRSVTPERGITPERTPNAARKLSQRQLSKSSDNLASPFVENNLKVNSQSKIDLSDRSSEFSDFKTEKYTQVLNKGEDPSNNNNNPIIAATSVNPCSTPQSNSTPPNNALEIEHDSNDKSNTVESESISATTSEQKDTSVDNTAQLVQQDHTIDNHHDNSVITADLGQTVNVDFEDVSEVDNTIVPAVDRINAESAPVEKDESTGAIPKRKPTQQVNNSEGESSELHNRAELKGLREFAAKYLAENAQLNPAVAANNGEGDINSDEESEMAPTIRRNSGGYTSYVFISNDETGSVHSSAASGGEAADASRVTVNLKERALTSPNTCVVSIQDGRASNISIVSTESSELNSPVGSPIMEDPPALPMKTKDHGGLQQVVYATRDSFRDFSHRSRGGEEPIFYSDDVSPLRDEEDRGGLANYFTSGLEASFISRRGRPPVIRAAEKVRRQQGNNFEYADEARGMMIDYSDHQDYRQEVDDEFLEEDDYVDEEYGMYRESSSTPVLDTENYRQRYKQYADDGLETGDYEQYPSGESGEEYIDEELVAEQYGMCQPAAYDDDTEESYSHSEGEMLSGDEFDREEELRGYNRAIDFTLHTIIEESCEDSEAESRAGGNVRADLRRGGRDTEGRKRMSDPTALEKYFFYEVGGGEPGRPDDSELSEEHSDEENPRQAAGPRRAPNVQQTTSENTRLADYFLGGFTADKQNSLDGISDRNTDDSGSVGSESDGQASPEHRRRKVSKLKHRSDRGESDNNSTTLEEDVSRSLDLGNSSGEETNSAAAFSSAGEGDAGTIKRKKNKAARKQPHHVPTAAEERRMSIESAAAAGNDTADGGKQNIIIDEDGETGGGSSRLSPTSSINSQQSLTAVKSQRNDGSTVVSAAKAGSSSQDGGSSKTTTPSTSPPPVAGPVRKHKSRDSGFVGSNDDLLRNEGVTSSDDTQGGRGGELSSEGESDSRKQVGTSATVRLEKVSEHSENTEEEVCDSMENDNSAAEAKAKTAEAAASESSPQDRKQKESTGIVRHDSFHQWSSDEETNIMMNRMRTFFRNMMQANASKPSSSGQRAVNKSSQVQVHFEQQLTTLMRTVPGINEQQVKELVEYLSSEDTWSDSFDDTSSDCYTDATSMSEDMEIFGEDRRGSRKGSRRHHRINVVEDYEEEEVPEIDVVIQDTPAVGSSAVAGVEGMDSAAVDSEFERETALMYQKLRNSVAKMRQDAAANSAHEDEVSRARSADQGEGEGGEDGEGKGKSTTVSRILQQISSRLVTLMHEVSASESSQPSPSTSSVSSQRSSGRRRLRNSGQTATPSPKQALRSDENENENNFNNYFESLDSPKVLMGSSIGNPSPSNPFSMGGKNTGSDFDVWAGSHRDGGLMGGRRGSLPRGQLDSHGSNSGVSDTGLEDERFSWKGSFESTLATADSRTRLSIEAKSGYALLKASRGTIGGAGVRYTLPKIVKDLLWTYKKLHCKGEPYRFSSEDRRSVEYGSGSEIFSSVEGMDRNHPGGGPRSPVQSARRNKPPALHPRGRLDRMVAEPSTDASSNLGRNPGQDSDSDSASISSSVRSSRYTGSRRSSIPETGHQLARLAEDSAPASPSPPASPPMGGSRSPPPATADSPHYVPRPVLPAAAGTAKVTVSTASAAAPGSGGLVGSVRHNTNSLPRLGTSSIQKKGAGSSGASIVPVTNTAQPTNIQTSTQGGGIRSARFRPHGYKPLPAPQRKSSASSLTGLSPGSLGSQRKASLDSLGRITDDYDVSSKSGTPSPMISRVGAAHLSATDLRDLREPSAARSLREGSTPRSLREGSAGTVASDGSGSLAAEFGGGDGGFDGAHGGKSSNGGSSLGTRSESLASIYSQGEGRYGTVNVRGEIELGYLYNTNTKTVDINIKQCKDLAPVDTKRNRSDPYVKVYLLPDRSKAAKRKTKVKKHTLNPVFDEILKFGLPSSEIGRRTMWVSVWHSDMFGRNDFLGEVLLPLAGQSMEDPTSKWFTLQDRSETPEDENGQTGRGDIILALKYVPAERKVVNDKKKRGTLVLIVKEAKNIPFNKHNTLPDTFCKCYLLPDRSARAKQKTSVCRRTTAPRWETTLAWEDVGDLETRALELTLWETDRMGHHEEMGGVRLNLGTGRAGGQTASWMDAQGREISIWQQMMDRQNFWVEASIPLRQLTHEQNRADK